MAANITDLLTRVTDSTTGRPVVSALAAPGKAIAAASVNITDATNWTTTTGIHFSIYVVSAAGIKDTTSQTDWKGTLSGTTISNLTLTGGTDRTYVAGSIIELTPTARWAKDLYEWGISQHTVLGAHGVVTATSVDTPILKDNSTILSTIRSEVFFDYIASGGVWAGLGYGLTLTASMTALVCYINGQRGTIAAIATRTFTVIKDTYVDILNSSGVFSIVYTEVGNGAASPALAANSIRLGIIVTTAGSIAAVGSVNQGQEDRVLPIASSIPYAVTDSLGNLICPRDSNRRILGNRQIVADFTTTTAGSYVDVTGLSATVIAPTGRKVKITAAPRYSNSTEAAGSAVWMNIVQDGTQIVETVFSTSVTSYAYGMFAQIVITPTAGNHTYKVQVKQDTAGAYTFHATVTSPGFLTIELV